MDLHLNARSCPKSRMLMVQRHQAGWSVASIARAMGLTRKTVRKWLLRYEREGARGLFDRSSRPHRQPSRTSKAVVAQVLELRRARKTGRAIAEELGVPLSTVGLILRRHQLQRLRLLDPPEPVVRYEHDVAGSMLHLDIKKLGRFDRPGKRTRGRVKGHATSRGAGWEFVHVAIDDYSRVAYVEVLDDEKGQTAVGFLQRAVAWFESYGVRIQRVLTDNGSCYRSRVFAAACRALGAKHKTTRPYRPQTNGKAERFIKTLLTEWAYVAEYGSSLDRRRALPHWLRHYNERRIHSAIGYQPPVSRLPASGDNVLSNHS